MADGKGWDDWAWSSGVGIKDGVFFAFLFLTVFSVSNFTGQFNPATFNSIFCCRKIVSYEHLKDGLEK